MADSPFIVELNESNYQQIVLQGSQQVPVLVDFWASWCQPCQMLMPVLAKLADEYNGRFILAKLNTEEQQAIAAQYGIRSIPAVKLFKDGVPVDEFSGALPEVQIREFLEKHLPRASDGTVAEAEEKLLAGDLPGALALLEQARAADPGNPRIVTAMAQVHAQNGDPAAAAHLLDELPEHEQQQPEIQQMRGLLFFAAIAAEAEPVASLASRLEANPDDSAARYALAANQVNAGETEQALDNLLLLMQKDRRFGDDAARQALLKLFDMLGDDPAVTRYRARMFNLLH